LSISATTHCIEYSLGLAIAPQLAADLLAAGLKSAALVVLGFLRNHPTVAIGGALPRLPSAGRDLRALSRDRRPDCTGARQAHARAIRVLLVRQRYAGPRHLLTRALRSTGLAHRRPFGGDTGHGSPVWPSASSRVSCAGPSGIIMRFIDGLMSIPPILLAVRADGADTGQRRQRHPGDHDRPESRRVDAPRAQRRAVAARAALCRLCRGFRTGTPMIILRHHPAQTPWRRCCCRQPYICASAMIVESILSFIMAPARRPPFRPGVHHGRG